MANRFLSNIRINDAYTLPASDGTSGQVISTDGAGNLSFTDASTGGAPIMYRDDFAGDGSTVLFQLANPVSNIVQTQVYIDGTYQEKETYSVNGQDLTFLAAPPNGTSIEVISLTSINFAGDFVLDTLRFTGGTADQGTLSWNAEDETLDLIVSPNVTYQIGQELGHTVRNLSGVTLNNGAVVRVTGASGNKITVDLADNTAELGSSETFAVVTETINNNSTGKVTTEGLVRDLDTSAFAEGVAIWLGANGTFTDTKPQTPNHLVHIGWVVRSHATEGAILVKVSNGWEMEELHDVLITSVADKDMLVWNSTLGYWENSKTLGDITTGNITTDGTVDGVDISAFKAAYDVHTHVEGDITDFGNYLTNITHDTVNNKLVVTTRDAATFDVDLTQYIDDSNLARLTSGSLDAATGIATFTRDDATTFTVDFSALFDDTDTNDYVSSASFNTSDGVLTLTRTDAGTVTVDLDGRYLESYTETDTLATVTGRGATTTSDLETGRLTIANNVSTGGFGSFNDYQIILYKDTTASTTYGLGIEGSTFMFHTNGVYRFYANNAVKATISNSGDLTLTGTISASGYNNSNWDTAYGWGDHASAGYLTSLPSHTHDDRYLVKGGSWNGANMPGSRWGGFSANGGEVVFQQDNPNTGQMSVMVDGNFYAGENNGFWSLYSSNSYNSKAGMYANSSGYLILDSPSRVKIKNGSNSQMNINFDQIWTDSGNLHLQYSGSGNIDMNQGGGYAFSRTSLRAPIFYDSQDTNYYSDPNGLTRAKAINVGTNVLTGNTTYPLGVSNGQRYQIGFQNSSSSEPQYYPWLVHDDWNGSAIIFHYNGIGDKFRFSRLGIGQADTDWRAPIFYDSNNTAWYTDPSSRSILNTLQLGSDSSDTTNLKLDVQGNMAIRGTNGLYYGVTTNNYNSWTTRMFASGSTQYFNAQQFIFDNQGYGSTTFATINSQGVSANVFRDSADTNYYLDPASDSRLNNIVDSRYNTFSAYRHSGSDFVNGTLVATDIPATATSGASFVIEVTGKSYTTNVPPFSFMAQGYLYNNTIIATSGVNNGDLRLTYIKVMELNGYLHFWWPRISYWNSFEVRVRDAGGGPANRATNIIDSSDPSGATKKVQINLAKSVLYDFNTNSGDLYGSIYYDANNTSYYLNPDSTSLLYSVAFNGNTSLNSNELRLVGLSDGNHYLKKIATGYSGVTIDGPQLQGHQGGELTTNYTGNNWALRWSIGGNVIINNNLTMNKTSTYGDAINITYAGSQSIGGTIRNNTGSNRSAFDFYYSSLPQPKVGAIVINSSSTSFVTTSDYRAKENVVPMTGALDRVSLLKPSKFNFIGEEDVVDGFLAHEVQEVVPEAITGTKDEVDDEGNPLYQGIDQSKIVPLLVGAIQELKAEVEALKQQLNGTN